MKKTGLTQRLLAAALAFCMAVAIAPPIAAADATAGGGTAAPVVGKVTVTGFSALPSEVREQAVPIGTSLDALTLPATLDATVSGDKLTQPESSKAVTIENVTWKSTPAYDGAAEGKYIFAAVLPNGYAVGNGTDVGVSLPEITVTVAAGSAVAGSGAEKSNVEKVIDMLDALPTMEAWTAMPEDAARAVMSEVLAADNAYKALTAEEKALVDTARTTKLAELAALAQQLAGAAPMADLPDIANGESGNCNWVIDAAGVLTISAKDGTDGVLGTYSYNNRPPWYPNYEKITSVVVQSGVKTGTSAESLFSGLTLCTSMELSGLDTSAATTMRSMFNQCSALLTLDLSAFDTAAVTTMSGMFTLCNSMSSVDVSSFDTAKVTDMSHMFIYCDKLSSLDLMHFDTAKVGNMRSMFDGCSSLTSVLIKDWKTGALNDTTNMFKDCVSLTQLDLSGWNTTSLKEMFAMFQRCTSLTSLDISSFNTEAATVMTALFDGCESLTSINLNNIKTTSAKKIGYMFAGCKGLTSVDISGFDTKNATELHAMFRDCSSLTTLDVSKLNTQNAKSLSEMFSGCTELTALDVSTFKTENVTNMSKMFNGCSSLTSLNVSAFNTANVTNMSEMFSGCSGLTSLDVSALNTANVTDMSKMFSGCSKLSALDLSTFDTAKITLLEKISKIFYGCTQLAELTLSAIPLPKVSTSAFEGCPTPRILKLVDANGVPLAGADFDNALATYKAVPDNNKTDNRWWGWKIITTSVAITVNKDGTAWTDHGKTFNLVSGSTKITDLTEVPNDTYDIYDGTTDTGINVTVNGAAQTATVNYYTVSYSGGGTIANAVVFSGGKPKSPTRPTKTGYTFGAWYKDSSYSNAWDFFTDTVTATTTLYAKWTPKNYVVSLDVNGGSGGTVINSYTYGTGVALPTDWKKTNYTFDGWFEDDSFSGSKVTEITATDIENKTYHAKWTGVSYTVTLNGNGGSGGTGLTTYTYGTGAALPTDWTKPDYTFDGWFEDPDFNGTEVTAITSADTGNKIYHAKWKLSRATLTDAQMTLTMPGWTYGNAESTPTGSVTVTDTNGSFTYLYSTNGTDNWVNALPKSTEGKVKAGTYSVKMSYIGDNYVGSKTITVTVAKKDTTVSITCAGKTYDGSASATVVYTVTGKVGNDEVIAAGMAEYTDENSNNNKTVTATGISFSGTDADNYNLTAATATTTANIVPKLFTPTTIETIPAQAFTGSQLTPAVIVKDGSTTLTLNKDYTVTFGTNINASADAGRVTVTPKGNYSGTAKTISFTIAKAAAPTVADSTVSVAYGDTANKTYALTGLPANLGDNVTFTTKAANVTDSFGILNGTPTVDAATGALSYQLTTGLTEADNHKTASIVIEVNSTNYNPFTVKMIIQVTNKTDVSSSITFADGSATYNGAVQLHEAASISGQTGGGINYTYATVNGALEGDKPKGAGIYTVTAVYENAIAKGSKTATFTIKPKQVTVKADNKSMKKGESVPALTVSYSGFGGADSEANALTTQAIVACASDGRAPGSFFITFSTYAVLNAGVGKNYTLAHESGKLQVTDDNANSDAASPKEENQPGMPTNPTQPQNPETPKKPSVELPKGDMIKTVSAELAEGKILPQASEPKIETGKSDGIKSDTESTVMTVGTGAVIVTVSGQGGKRMARVNDTAAVANAVLSNQEKEMINTGEVIEIRIDVKDIAGTAPRADKEVVKRGIEAYQAEIPDLELGMYVDISVFMRIGNSEWNSITSTDEPLEVTVEIPEELRRLSAEFVIIRAHEGEFVLLKDTDNNPATITINTQLFSTYAITYPTKGEQGVVQDTKIEVFEADNSPKVFCLIDWMTGGRTSFGCMWCLIAIVAILAVAIGGIVWRCKRKQDKY